MADDPYVDAERRMKKAVEALQRDLQSIRTGRASPALVERLMVEYYGTPTPLLQIAGIHATDARTPDE
jgi:ribosome recycling factor